MNKDISHSSAERIMLPDVTIALDYALNRFTNIVDRLTVYEDNMQANIDKTFGLIYSQRVLLSLINKVWYAKKRMIQCNQKL